MNQRRRVDRVDSVHPSAPKTAESTNVETALTRENTKTVHPLGTRDHQARVDMSTLSTLHALYRFWSADQQLLYVGITLDPGSRWKQHRADKPWWSEVASITVETHPNRTSVLDAERQAIQTEHPVYNIVHNRGKHTAPPEIIMPEQQNNLIGLYFHTYATRDDCGHHHIEWQGQVVRDLGGGWHFCNLHSWVHGGFHNAIVRHVSAMADWRFLYDPDDWSYEGDLQSERSARCTEKSLGIAPSGGR